MPKNGSGFLRWFPADALWSQTVNAFQMVLLQYWIISGGMERCALRWITGMEGQNKMACFFICKHLFQIYSIKLLIFNTKNPLLMCLFKSCSSWIVLLLNAAFIFLYSFSFIFTFYFILFIHVNFSQNLVCNSIANPLFLYQLFLVSQSLRIFCV